MEAELGSVPPVKRARGRPRKTVEPAAVSRESLGDGPGPQKATFSIKAKRKRRRNGETPISTFADVSLIGQQVTGVLEGSFDAGYLLSLRVGNTDTMLRGVVFGPGMSIPISTTNDVTPNAELAGKDDIISPLFKAVALKPMPLAPTHTLDLQSPESIPPTSAVLKAAASVLTNPVTTAVI